MHPYTILANNASVEFDGKLPLDEIKLMLGVVALLVATQLDSEVPERINAAVGSLLLNTVSYLVEKGYNETLLIRVAEHLTSGVLTSVTNTQH